MTNAKVSPSLAREAEVTADDDSLDVVVELNPVATPPTEGSRQEQIAAAKQAFEEGAGSVGQSIIELGGEVLAAAWINQTLRTRVPKRALRKLANNTRVRLLDTARSLNPES